MVIIGTRAIISIDGKPMLATHWDGHPAWLGRDLLRSDKSVKAVIQIANAHTIDAADPALLETLNRERISQLAEKHRLSMEQIKAGIRRGNVISADDYEIADIRTYRDLAEFEYEIRGNAVYVRPLDGWWPESLRKAGEFRRLTAKGVASRPAGYRYRNRALPRVHGLKSQGRWTWPGGSQLGGCGGPADQGCA